MGNSSTKNRQDLSRHGVKSTWQQQDWGGRHFAETPTVLSRTLLCNFSHLNALPTLSPLPQQHPHPGLVSVTSSLERTHLLMLSNGSKTRRLHVVTPAAQPVIIPCRRQSGSQSHLTAQADSGTEQGLTSELTELPWSCPTQGQNNGLLPPNSEQLAQPRGLSELYPSMRLKAPKQGPHIQQGVSKALLLSKTHLAGHAVQSNSLLLILKCDRPMVCLTMLGVTVLIFHRSSFLCSQGSFSTGERQGQRVTVRR